MVCQYEEICCSVLSYPIVKPILSHLCTMIKFNNYHLATFGVESVAVTDTTGGRVCLECSFSSFSTDIGCTVELVSSDSSSSVQYIETITRSSNSTAEGCVSDVTEGVYDVKVYDQSSSELVNETTDVTVLLLLSTTTNSTTTNSMLHSSTVSTVALTTNESQSEHMGYNNVVL